MEMQTMSNPVGLRASQARLPRPRPTMQITFAGAWTAMIAFCALTWTLTLSLIL